MRRSAAWWVVAAGYMVLGAGVGGGLGGGLAGCSSNSTTSSSDVQAKDVSGSTRLKFAISKLTLPILGADYAIDLNGDGRPDNQLGNIIGALQAEHLDAQSPVDKSITEGAVVELFEALTNDPALKSDPAISVTLFEGVPEMADAVFTDAGVLTGCAGCPDFSGGGSFTIDSKSTPGAFYGKLGGGSFSSNNPVTTKAPVTFTLRLKLVDGSDPLELVVNGAHVQFTTGDDGAGHLKLTKGEIHGSIKDADVHTHILPAVVDLLNNEVKVDNCMGATTKSIQSLFDTGACGTCAAAPATPCLADKDCAGGDKCNITATKNDCKFELCEVALNNLILNVLNPDVQIYSSDGKYSPNRSSMPPNPDSLSLGLSFEAVTASF